MLTSAARRRSVLRAEAEGWSVLKPPSGVSRTDDIIHDVLYRRDDCRGWAAQMGRFTRAIRGFFGRFLSGVEQRNPEILLENAVQDELENLKKLQVAAARTMAYEKMLANDAVTKQKTLAVKERQARELASRGQREAAIEVVQQKQEAQTSLTDIEMRLEEARKNSQELEQAFRDQERRYNNVVRERAALMEEHQRSRALRTANEARSNISLSDSTRDLEKARQSIRQSSYEAEAIGELGTSDTERQIAAAEIDIKRLDAEQELEMMEVQMGLREPEPIEAAPNEETVEPLAEETEEGQRGQ